MGQSPSGWKKLAPDTTRMTALVYSDTHADPAALDRFFAFEKSHPHPVYDAVLMPGDFSNIKFDQHADPVAESQAEKDAVFTLEAITKHFPGIPVIFLPGNHETTKLYNDSFVFPGALNLHRKALDILPGLTMLGFGGAVPGIAQDPSGHWTNVWEGYPQKTDAEFSAEIKAWFEHTMEAGEKGRQYVMMTHLGPWDVATTVSHTQVQSGSKGLLEILDKHNEQIVCNIHGHTHDAPGMVRRYLSPCVIINPGASVHGMFAEVSIEKGKDSLWALADAKFVTIPL